MECMTTSRLKHMAGCRMQAVKHLIESQVQGMVMENAGGRREEKIKIIDRI